MIKDTHILLDLCKHSIPLEDYVLNQNQCPICDDQHDQHMKMLDDKERVEWIKSMEKTYGSDTLL